MIRNMNRINVRSFNYRKISYCNIRSLLKISSSIKIEKNSMSKSRGAFILFEGVDNSGKTTQAKKLVKSLNENKIVTEYVNFPDRTTETGKIINRYLSGNYNVEPDCMHLLFCANRFEKRLWMMERINEGITLVVDRYAYSGVAFTVAKEKEKLNKTWCMAIEAGKIPKPDVVFFLDLPTEYAANREEYGNEIYEKNEFQKKVREVYLEFSEDEEWIKIDANKSIDIIHNEILNESMNMIKQCKTGKIPLEYLWNHNLTHNNLNVNVNRIIKL